VREVLNELAGPRTQRALEIFVEPVDISRSSVIW
jgi:hypothetical protein